MFPLPLCISSVFQPALEISENTRIFALKSSTKSNFAMCLRSTTQRRGMPSYKKTRYAKLQEN